jgi:[protein-PII] uridylyltransferase
MLVQDASFAKLPKAAPYEYEAKLQQLPPITGDVRADFAAQRRFIEEVHRAGASGHTVVRLAAAAMDRIVLLLWERAVDEAARKHAPTRVALIALGGYGRRELAPFSDVDLLVLHEHREPGPFVKEASERFLYSLWDLKLEVGYGVRDVQGCEQLANEDTTARTALLDLRYLAGDRELYRELEREALHGLSQAKVDAFIADKIRETRQRRERFGDSLYLLEPNVKESEAGLRDLQMALWTARARFKVAGITELLARAVLPEPEVRELRRARDFVWRVRNELHFLTGRKTDQLTFDLQPQVAAAMGYG